MITKKNPAQRRLEQNIKGFTLTEIAIVLGIMGLILGAIWVAAASVYSSQRVNTANTAVAQITQNVRTLYATSASTGLAKVDMTADLVTAKAIPANLINGTGALVGPFPGGSTMVISNADSAGFVIAMSRLPRAACIALLSSIGGSGRDPALFRADATTSADLGVGDGSDETTPPLEDTITPAIAAAATQTKNGSTYGGCTGSSNSLYKASFGFALK